MTIEEALARNFTCEKIPGRPSIPMETCIARQEKAKEIRKAWQFPHCVDCVAGRDNIKIWEGKNKMVAPHKITCWCCERENQSWKKNIADHKVCGFCAKHLTGALEAGVTIEDAKKEIMPVAQNLNPGRRSESDSWSWAKIKQETSIFTEEQHQEKENGPQNFKPCLYSGCQDFNIIAERNCGKGKDPEECDRQEHTLPAGGRLVDFKSVEVMPVPESMKAPEPELLVALNLMDETAILAMLERRMKRNRRSRISDEILAILDEQCGDAA